MSNIPTEKKRGRPKCYDDDAGILSKAKGDRLKWIRSLANLSQEELSSASEINATTIKSWEQGRFGGLTMKGAARIVSFLETCGVFCSVEWLLSEVGAGPELKSNYRKINEPVNASFANDKKIDETKVILEELHLFRQLNPNSIDYIVKDESMMPHYHIGDYVAGTKRVNEEILALIGLDCIVVTLDGELILRTLQAGPKVGFYNLVCTNFLEKLDNNILYSVRLASASPIIWHRRKQPSI